MADLVGASSGAMQAAEANFTKNVASFDAAVVRLQKAVTAVKATFLGTGSDMFQQAYEKWQTSMKNIRDDLEALSNAIKITDQNFRDLDASIAKAFSGF